MAAASFTLFETEIGPMGIVWSAVGLTGVQLPERTRAATQARLLERFPGATETPPSPPVAEVMGGIVRLLRGERVDLTGVALDLTGLSPFFCEVYAAARGIPAGSTLSYGQIAARLGKPGASRAVGRALGRNPFAIVVPCHRVLAAGGKLGGFTAEGGIATKQRILELERGRGATSPAAPGGFSFDVANALDHLRGADPKLGALIERVGPFRMELRPSADAFGSLARAIAHQQLSTKAAETIWGRVAALYTDRGGIRATLVRQTSIETLRAAGLSNSKALSLLDLAEKSHTGAIPELPHLEQLSNDEIIAALTQVRGVGRWTAEMFLMFRLGRPDVLPIDDYGIRKGFARAFRSREMPTPEAVARRGARWAPYRTIASWYLWRALDLAG